MVTAFLSIVGGRIFIVLSSVVLTPILITTLGFELYGRYSTLTAVFGISTILMSSGINSGARKYLSEDRSHRNWETHVFGYYFRLGTVLAVLTAVAFAAAARFGIVTRYLGPEYVVGFYGLAGLTIATQFREYSRRALMGLKQEHRSEPLRVLNKVGSRLVLIGIAYLGFEIGGLMVGLVVVNSLVALLALWWLRTNVSLRGIFSRTPDRFPTRELFSFNHLSVVYMLFLTSMYHVDVLMLASHVTETQVGYYKSALVISQFLWVIPRSIQSMLIQSVSDLWAAGRTAQITEIASRVTRYGMLVVLLLSIGLGTLAKDFVPLYLGEGSMPVVLPLLVLLPGTIGFAVVRPILAISHAKADMKPLIAATGAAALLNLVLNAVLIPRYGITGAAIATTTGYSSLPIFNLFSARYLGFKPFADARIGRVLGTGLIAGVPIVLVSMAIGQRLLALAVVPPVGFVVFVTVAFLTGAVDVDEALDVLSSLPGPIGARASAIHSRRTGLGGDGPSWGNESWADRHKDTFQRGLLVIGVLLSLSGVVLAVGAPDVGVGPSVDGDSPVPEVNATTPITDTPMPTTTESETSTATGTETPDTSTQTETESPTETTTPTETTESDDDGGFFGGGGGDDGTTTETATTSETTTTETSTASEITTTQTSTDTTNSPTTETATTTESSTTDAASTTESSTTTTATTTESSATTTATTTESSTTDTTTTESSTTTTETTTESSTTDTATTTSSNETTGDDTSTATTTDSSTTTTTESTTTETSDGSLLMIQPLSSIGSWWTEIEGTLMYHSALLGSVAILAGRNLR
ncbi:lipopolysaccharide biosynthesis protein [Halobellus rufus]|uniref:lipopolysaccharide biosynthesis protein n=1 Tax=Halobellus rufus TaxID=1448860 RepID=UPI000678E2B8|nr:lipopolysaccharide biosynthesis protein [Halobellus rufus]